ncbi:hypothetical protein VNO80_16961 [Phaseolus coccineus]|uniref:Uncharacterized protein n=1 Tax=Phaseolus coccineus TaxID=3886 RepID=A0AAN9R3Q1_PHACN
MLTLVTMNKHFNLTSLLEKKRALLDVRIEQNYSETLQLLGFGTSAGIHDAQQLKMYHEKSHGFYLSEKHCAMWVEVTLACHKIPKSLSDEPDMLAAWQPSFTDLGHKPCWGS